MLFISKKLHRYINLTKQFSLSLIYKHEPNPSLEIPKNEHVEHVRTRETWLYGCNQRRKMCQMFHHFRQRVCYCKLLYHSRRQIPIRVMTSANDDTHGSRPWRNTAKCCHGNRLLSLLSKFNPLRRTMMSNAEKSNQYNSTPNNNFFAHVRSLLINMTMISHKFIHTRVQGSFSNPNK